MIEAQLTHPMFFGQGALQLLQQYQPVAKDDNLLTLIELPDNLAGKHGFACTGRRFHDKAAMRFQDRRKPINNLLLPSTKLHEPNPSESL